MWVKVKSTGDMIEINLDKDRPATFDSKESEIQWEKATAKNALKFKNKVESGEFIPAEIIKKIEQKVNRTPEEEEILIKQKQMATKMEKVITNLNFTYCRFQNISFTFLRYVG